MAGSHDAPRRSASAHGSGARAAASAAALGAGSASGGGGDDEGVGVTWSWARSRQPAARPSASASAASAPSADRGREAEDLRVDHTESPSSGEAHLGRDPGRVLPADDPREARLREGERVGALHRKHNNCLLAFLC